MNGYKYAVVISGVFVVVGTGNGHGLYKVGHIEDRSSFPMQIRPEMILSRYSNKALTY